MVLSVSKDLPYLRELTSKLNQNYSNSWLSNATAHVEVGRIFGGY